MSALVSRLVIAVAGLPIVLGAAWVGGWWLLALVAVGTILALHELYAATRELRPLALAGFGGALTVLLGTQFGGLEWIGLGLLVTLLGAFCFAALADTSQSNTVSVATTTLSVVWIAVGLAHLTLIRADAVDSQSVDRGRLAIFTVLIAVFATDTAAYLVGRLAGRHRLAPRLSPGKTVEGFVAGALAGIFVTWVAMYDEGYLEIWESLVLGAVIVAAATLGDLLESLVKRDLGVKDMGTLLAGHGGVLDRVDSLLLAGPAAYYTLLAFGAAAP